MAIFHSYASLPEGNALRGSQFLRMKGLVLDEVSEVMMVHFSFLTLVTEE